jgi:hypothetical protein
MTDPSQTAMQALEAALKEPPNKAMLQMRTDYVDVKRAAQEKAMQDLADLGQAWDADTGSDFRVSVESAPLPDDWWAANNQSAPPRRPVPEREPNNVGAIQYLTRKAHQSAKRDIVLLGWIIALMALGMLAFAALDAFLRGAI